MSQEKFFPEPGQQLAKVPRGRLTDEHLPLVRGLLDQHPDAGLWRLTELVQHRCKLPKLAHSTLRAFLVDHGITPPKPRPKPAKPPRKTACAKVNGAVVMPPPPTPAPALRLVHGDHKALAASQNSIFALGGLCPAPALKNAVAGLQSDLARQRLTRRRAELLASAHDHAAGWLSAAEVGRAAGAALTAALHALRVEPDDTEFDPDCPGEWFDPMLFAEDVADLFRLAIFDLARRSGHVAAAHECSLLSTRAGAPALLRAIKS